MSNPRVDASSLLALLADQVGAMSKVDLRDPEDRTGVYPVLESLASWIGCMSDDLPGDRATWADTMSGLVGNLCRDLGMPDGSRAPFDAYVATIRTPDVFGNVLAAMQPAEELGGPEREPYVRLMLKIAAEATRRADACLANVPEPAQAPKPDPDRDLALAVIKILRSHGIAAEWEFPGYLHVRTVGGPGLAYGTATGDRWSGHADTDDDGRVDPWWSPAEVLLGDATPERIAEILIAGHADALRRVGTPVYRLDAPDESEHVTLADFWGDNHDTDPDTLVTLASLRVGQTYTGGGGASPEWSLTRVV